MIEQKTKMWSFYAYWVWMSLLTVAYFYLIHNNYNQLLPFAWGAIGLSGILAIIIGVLRYKPAAWKAWLLLAAANLFFIAGDSYYKVKHYLLNVENPFPSLSDALYLTTYPLFAIGTFMFIRRHSIAKTDRGAILDAATFTVGLTLLVWIYLVMPNASVDATLLEKMTSIAYPIGDVLVWAMLVRLLMIDARTRAVQLLAVGAVGLIIADIIYGLGQFYGFWQEGGLVDLGWILFYASWGAAALHPSMKALDTKVAKGDNIHIRRLALLAAAALLAPLVLLVETLRGNAGEVGVVVAGFAATLFVLVVLRMFTLLKIIGRRDAEIALEKQKQEVISLVSHQLRTPLTVIQLYTESIKNVATIEKEMLQKAVDTIDTAGRRLAELIRTLLYSTSVSMDEVAFHVKPQDLQALTNAAVEQNKSLLSEKQVHYEVQTEGSLPLVPTDQEAIVTALGYIINNAAQYSKAEGASLTIRLSSDDVSIHIDVEDNGVGIPVDDQPRIFTKLFRASNAITSFPDGVGLGLFLAKNVVNRLGGDIKFTSKPGVGTTFRITLPLKNALYVKADTATTVAPVGAQAENQQVL